MRPPRSKRAEAPKVELSPKRRAELEAHNQAMSQKVTTGDRGLDEEIDEAFDRATRPQVKGKKRPTIEGRGISTRDVDRLDGEDIARLEGESLNDAITRVQRVIGRPVSETPLAAAWQRARARVLAGREVEELGKNGATKAYKDAQELFWAEVRADAAARSYLSGAGFVLGEAPAPLLRITRALPVQQVRVSLDHAAEKALGTNWRRALDADNLELEFQDPNTWREVIQVRHRMREPLKKPGD
jgi:hypothetical protein